jgi:hypothetical protein
MEVAKIGMGSKTQKRVANTKIAITRCSIIVRFSMGIESVGITKIKAGINIEISNFICFIIKLSNGIIKALI